MHDLEEQFNVIWDALEAFRDDCIPEGEEAYDDQWDDICLAMALIREATGLEDEVTLAKKRGEI